MLPERGRFGCRAGIGQTPRRQCGHPFWVIAHRQVGKQYASSAAAHFIHGSRCPVPGNGWTLKVNSASPVRVVGITARCAANSTCTLPTAVTMPSGNIVLRAAPDTGMGVMNLVVTLAAQSGSTPVSFSVS
jgi:hypothetical protein